MCGRSSRDQFVRNSRQAPAHRAINDEVAGAQYRAPSSSGSVVQCRRTSRLRRRDSALANDCCCRSSSGAAGRDRHVGDPFGVVLERIEQRRRFPAGHSGDAPRPACARSCDQCSPRPAPARSSTSCDSCAGGHMRITEQRFHARIGDHLRRGLQRRGPRPQHAVGTRLGESGLGVRTGDGDVVGHGLDLCCELVQKLSVRSRVDFALQHFRCSTHQPDSPHPCAAIRGRASFPDRSVSAPMPLCAWPRRSPGPWPARPARWHASALIQNLGRALARFLDHGVGLDLRLRERLLALIRGCQTLGDLARALFHGTRSSATNFIVNQIRIAKTSI